MGSLICCSIFGHVSLSDWPSWNQSSAFEGQSGVDTCHHGIWQKSFLAVIWGGKASCMKEVVWPLEECFWRLQSSGAGRRLSLQIWLEGQIREKKSWVTEEKKRKIFWGVLEFEGWSRESFWRKQREREGKRVKRGKFSGSLRRLQRRKLWEREGLGLNYEGKCELLGA